MDIEHQENGERLVLHTAGELATIRSAAVIYSGDLPRFAPDRREVRAQLLGIASRASEACAEHIDDPGAEALELDVPETKLCLAALAWTVGHPKRFLSEDERRLLVDMHDQLQQAG